MKQPHRGQSLILLAFVFLLIISVLFSICIGRYPLAIGDVVQYIFTGKSDEEVLSTILINVRLPRVFIALITGGAIAIAGTAYQGLFRNPMVSPDILGVSSGAGFGASVAIVMSLGVAGIQLFAFAGGVGAVAISLLVSRIIGRNHDKILMLILSGMVTGAIFNALISLMKYLADSDSKLPDITFWLMGSFSKATTADLMVIIPVVIAGIIPIVMLGWKLNVMSCGEEEARTLGISTVYIRLIIIACASLITASVVCVVGLIGWVGLIVPHFARFLVGPNHKVLLPASFLIGSIFMLWVDNVARSASTLEIPIGILVSLIGAPLFLIFLKRNALKSHEN